MSGDDIAVIAPYVAEIRWLRQHAADFAAKLEPVEIDNSNVDAFEINSSKSTRSMAFRAARKRPS